MIYIPEHPVDPENPDVPEKPENPDVPLNEFKKPILKTFNVALFSSIYGYCIGLANSTYVDISYIPEYPNDNVSREILAIVPPNAATDG
jgi:hypothetical protein